MQLGLENKKQTMWAAVLGVVALLAIGYEVTPFFLGSSTSAASADPAPLAPHATARTGTKVGKKHMVENLDPTLRLDLLASSEKTMYEGSGRNIFVSQAEDIQIPTPKGSGVIGPGGKGQDATVDPKYTLPTAPVAPAIPLKFYGFANSAGEPRKIFLKLNDDVFVAGEGEIVDRRYKVVHITPTAVSIQDMVYSGPPQNIPLTQG